MGAPGWLSRLSVRLLVPAQVVISQFMSSSPNLYCVDSAENFIYI